MLTVRIECQKLPVKLVVDSLCQENIVVLLCLVWIAVSY